MKLSKICLVLSAIALIGATVVGCGSKTDAVDKPLMKDAPPPPPRPDKPEVTPSGAGGGAGAAPSSGTEAP